MKTLLIVTGFILLNFLRGGLSGTVPASHFPDYFYEELGCKRKDDTLKQYECPDFSITPGSCQFGKDRLKSGEALNMTRMRGSCGSHCTCTPEGLILCAEDDCFERLFSGCSHFKYSLDSCCAVDSVCGPIAECNVEGESYREGDKFNLQETCEVCVCDENFEKKAPFCKRRYCIDQVDHQEVIANYGAPVFVKKEKCCPTHWISDGGDEISKMNSDAKPVTAASCKFGKRSFQLHEGFKKTITPYGPYGVKINIKCECSTPPLVICREE